MPIYSVEISGQRRIVRAVRASQAVDYAVQHLVSVHPLTPDEFADAMAEGLRMEDARRPRNEDLPLPPAPPGGENSSNGAETYRHKELCPADSSIPIGQTPCRCTSLGLE